MTTGPISLFWLKLLQANMTKLQNMCHVKITITALVCFGRFKRKFLGKMCKILSGSIMRIIFIGLMLAHEAVLLLYKQI